LGVPNRPSRHFQPDRTELREALCSDVYCTVMRMLGLKDNETRSYLETLDALRSPGPGAVSFWI